LASKEELLNIQKGGQIIRRGRYEKQGKTYGSIGKGRKRKFASIKNLGGLPLPIAGVDTSKHAKGIGNFNRAGRKGKRATSKAGDQSQLGRGGTQLGEKRV